MRLRKDAKTDLISHVPLFSQCSKQELALVAGIADEIDLAEGKELTREGAPAREFFVLVDGTVRITKNTRKLADLGPGEWFGEIALITRGPRTATVTASSPVRVLVLTDRAFRQVVQRVPSIALKVLASVGERLGADARG